MSGGHSACSPAQARVSFSQVVANLRRQRDEVREKHRRLLQAHHERFHKVWGQLMKTGYQNSRFAHQVWMCYGGTAPGGCVNCNATVMHMLAEDDRCVSAQLERFACVYTSHVSNLSFYSPDKTFR